MDNTLENGTTLDGRFEIKKHINSGAFGIVYLVEDKEGNKRAIKELFRDDFCSRAEDKQRVYIDCDKCEKKQKDCHEYCQNNLKNLKEDMKNEVKIIQNINSNKILKVYEWFEENNTLYLVMEYIEGKNLKIILNKDIDYMFGTFPEKEIEKLLKDLCETLNVLHKNGYVHRDIKPENIMKNENGQYVLIDFSTIKKINTKVDSEVGTPHYKPPEYDKTTKEFYPSSDIYSLGMTIYHILKGGKPPPNYMDRKEKSIETRFQKKIDSIDNKFKNIIRKMTNLNPKERYQNMKEFGKEIKCGTNIFNIFLTLIIVSSVLIGGGVYLLTQKYSIDMQVIPPKAKIMIDGKIFKPNQKYSKGKHEISITKYGYEKEVIDIDLSRDNQPIKINLLSNSYLLKITIQPNNAKIYIKNIKNEKYKEYNKKVKYKIGKYDITIRCKGYKTYNRVIEVPKEKGFNYNLQPISSSIIPSKRRPFKPIIKKTTSQYSVTKSSNYAMSFNKAQKFCNNGTLPTIEEFKILDYKYGKRCYWSSKITNLKRYIYNGDKPYSNPQYDKKDKCYVICITPKSGGT